MYVWSPGGLFNFSVIYIKILDDKEFLFIWNYFQRKFLNRQKQTVLRLTRLNLYPIWNSIKILFGFIELTKLPI